jgi:hypothetical protein
VEFTTNLATRIFSALPFGSVSETNGIRYVSDGTATNAARFYRVRIARP